MIHAELLSTVILDRQAEIRAGAARARLLREASAHSDAGAPARHPVLARLTRQARLRPQ